MSLQIWTVQKFGTWTDKRIAVTVTSAMCSNYTGTGSDI